jgi:pyrroline-5-carboxylate reductase
MGSAIAERIKKEYPIYIFDKDPNKVKNVFGMTVSDSIDDLINKVDIIILAVKPQDFTTVLNTILDKSENYIKEKLIISIAAGITTRFIETCLGKVRLIRVMPNMPARVGNGMSCMCKGRYATQKDLNFTQQLFENLGQTLVLKEDMMDAATAISGSGPGFYYDLIENKPKAEWEEYASNIFIPKFSSAAESVGFNKEKAKLLANATIMGSLVTAMTTGETPAQLKKWVVSKGGTTEAGLKALHKTGSLVKAVKAACKRAKELSRG